MATRTAAGACEETVMTRRTPRRLQLKSETLRRLASDDMARVAGGLLNQRCTYERSGCYGHEVTQTCPNFQGGGGSDDCGTQRD